MEIHEELDGYKKSLFEKLMPLMDDIVLCEMKIKQRAEDQGNEKRCNHVLRRAIRTAINSIHRPAIADKIRDEEENYSRNIFLQQKQKTSCG